MKPCNTCGQVKPLESFVKNKSCEHGRSNMCKPCSNAYKASVMTDEQREKKAAYKKKYRAENRAVIAAKDRVYRAGNADSIKSYNDAYRDKNRDDIRLKSRNYYAANRERILEYFHGRTEEKKEYDREYLEKNKERISKRNSEFKKANPDKVRKHAHKRRAVAKGAEGSYSEMDIDRLKTLQRMSCANCSCCLDKAGYHVDHITALSKGGSNWPSNLQLLCPSCNVRKWAKDPIVFAQENGRLV